MNSTLVVGLVSLFTLTVFAPKTALSQSLEKSDLAAGFKVPPGVVVHGIVAAPLVNHPMMSNFDDRGWLFSAESSGLNLKADDLLKQLPNKVLVREDVDAKGRFNKSRVFADKMTFPSGA